MEWWMYLSVFTSLGAIIGFAVIIFKAGKWVGVINATRESFEKFTDKIDQAVMEIQKEFREDIRELRKEILLAKEVAPSSPLRLTDLGTAMSETIGGKRWAIEIAEKIGDEMKDGAPYDIQEFSRDYVHNAFEPTEEQGPHQAMCLRSWGQARAGVECYWRGNCARPR